MQPGLEKIKTKMPVQKTSKGRRIDITILK
jgi:hypothetical protein